MIAEVVLAHGPGGIYDWGPMVMGGGMLGYAYHLIRSAGSNAKRLPDEDGPDE